MTWEVEVLWDYLGELDVYEWILFSDLRSFSWTVIAVPEPQNSTDAVS